MSRPRPHCASPPSAPRTPPPCTQSPRGTRRLGRPSGWSNGGSTASSSPASFRLSSSSSSSRTCSRPRRRGRPAQRSSASSARCGCSRRMTSTPSRCWSGSTMVSAPRGARRRSAPLSRRAAAKAAARRSGSPPMPRQAARRGVREGRRWRRCGVCSGWLPRLSDAWRGPCATPPGLTAAVARTRRAPTACSCATVTVARGWPPRRRSPRRRCTSLRRHSTSSTRCCGSTRRACRTPSSACKAPPSAPPRAARLLTSSPAASRSSSTCGRCGASTATSPCSFTTGTAATPSHSSGGPEPFCRSRSDPTTRWGGCLCRELRWTRLALVMRRGCCRTCPRCSRRWVLWASRSQRRSKLAPAVRGGWWERDMRVWRLCGLGLLL
mmetsp:Transcript_5078/g.15105  ORF Transcript_5078/g.15105 Transcript_5078/m.15105 type:complete len:381 (+) Transcript_5078:978-2120(+)